MACSAAAVGRACREELRQALTGCTPRASGALTARAVAVWMSAKLGRPVRVQRGWDYLQRLKHRQHVPRSRHAQADPEQQETFKKRPPPAQPSHSGLPAGPGGGVGSGRISSRPQVRAPAGLGADRAATGRRRATPLPLALSGGLHPSRLGPHPLASGHQRLHPALCGGVDRLRTGGRCRPTSSWSLCSTRRAGTRAPSGACTSTSTCSSLSSWPPYSPELQPAEHLRQLTNTALATAMSPLPTASNSSGCT